MLRKFIRNLKKIQMESRIAKKTQHTPLKTQHLFKL